MRMIKALNCPPKEWQAADVQAWAAPPAHARALITWAPWPFNAAEPPDWQAADRSVAWAHSHGKQVIVCLPTQGAPPSQQAWENWAAGCLERYSKCLPVLTNEPMPALSATEVVAMTKTGCDLAVAAGHRRVLIAATDAVSQALEVIKLLEGWRPPRLKGVRRLERLQVGYAHHHYNDVTYHDGRPVEVKQILAALRNAEWCRAGLWLTEGGYRYATHSLPGASYPADPAYHAYTQLAADEAAQLANVRAHYRACERLGVKLWANYEVRDWLWGGWASGVIRAQNGPPGQGPDGPHPVASAWPLL
jgi:hypothetical protein